MTDHPLWSHRSPTQIERRLFVVLPILYAALVLAVVPVARVPSIDNPAVATVSATGILLADLCTALLLAGEYRRGGRIALLYLYAAYSYSALMAVLHLLTFPGAIVEGPAIGNMHTVGWLFPFWRVGTTALLLLAVLNADAAPSAASDVERRLILRRALAAGVIVCVALVMIFSTVTDPNMRGNAFGPFNIVLSWVSVALSVTGAALIWRKRAFNDALYLWLGLALVASAAELALSVYSGGRYTLGSYVSRASWVVSNCLLLVLWLAHASSDAIPPARRAIAEYGAALGVLAAALLLHWFMLPWLGPTFPFATTFAAVAVAVWLGGWAPAIVTAGFGYVVASTWFMAPSGVFPIADLHYLLGFLLYCITCGTIIGLGEAMRRARDNLRASERRLIDSTTELQRADVNKSNFLALLSHELRNPMAPLKNALALLALSPDRTMLGKVAPIMDRQLAHLSRLVDDLLDVSRIDRGKLELKRERIALDGVVKEAIETAKPNLDAKSHELVVHYAPHPILVLGDAVRLTQVLANLLNNAAKFTPTGGRVDVSLKATTDGAVIEVADNGIGIPPESMAKIFEMFVQLDSSRAVASGGLGLGLTLARSIAEFHGGSLQAHSDGAGKGSRFVLRLPIAAPEPSDEAPLPLVRRHNTPRNRILVVDDNQDAANTLADMLRLLGHDVRVALDGVSGMARAQEQPPDVAFVDVNMPGMTGLELGRRLRQDPRTRGIRLVALTGMGQHSDMAETRAAGFIAHLTKPASLQDVERLAAGREATITPIQQERRQ